MPNPARPFTLTDCFFDPAHGFPAAQVTWQPPHGVKRPIQVCLACQRRLIAEASPTVGWSSVQDSAIR